MTGGCGGLTGLTPLQRYRSWIVDTAKALGSPLTQYHSAAVAQSHRPVHRPFLDRQKAAQGNRDKNNRGDKDVAERRHQIAVERCDLFQRHDARTVGKAAEHERAEHRDNERAAERAEEIQRAGGGAHLMRLHRVLRHQRAHRIHRPEPQAEQKEQKCKLGQ